MTNRRTASERGCYKGDSLLCLYGYKKPCGERQAKRRKNGGKTPSVRVMKNEKTKEIFDQKEAEQYF